jgi:hypothetical protein
LAIPTQFIRTQDADIAATDTMIESAQQLFSDVATARKRELEQINTTTTAGVRTQSICVVGGMRFKLWADAAGALSKALSNDERSLKLFDTDSPLAASHLALARATAECRAVVAVDLYRSDSGPAARDELPWITWVTQPRIQPFSQAKPIDGLLLADPNDAAIALRAGWPHNRIVVARWPQENWQQPLRGALTVIADIPSLAAPAELEHFSSLRVLWDQLAVQIGRDPFCAFDRVEEIIRAAADSLDIGATNLNVSQFAEQLITPAYAVAVTRLLIQTGLPTAIYGSGWEPFGFARSALRGSIATREQLKIATDQAGALVHVWPTSRTHPSEFAGPPTIRYSGGGAAGWAAAARKVASARLSNDHPALSIAQVERLLQP